MKWISIKSKLPALQVEVITAIIDEDSGPNEVMRNWIIERGVETADGKYIIYRGWAQGIATHWIPLPR